MVKSENNLSLVTNKIIFLKNIPEITKKIKTIGCFNNKIFPSKSIFFIFTRFLYNISIGVETR